MSSSELLETLRKIPPVDLTKTAASSKSEIPIGKFCDLAALALGIGALSQWVKENQETEDPTKIREVKAHIQKGVAAARIHMDGFSSAMDSHFASLMERPEAATLRQPWREAQRPGSVAKVFARKGAVLGLLLPWMRRRHHELFSRTFTGASMRAAKSLAAAAALDEEASTLNNLATIPAVGGLRAPLKWNRTASELLGVEPTETETIQVEAESVQPQVDRLRDVNTALQSTNSEDEERIAELQIERATLQTDIEEAAVESVDPDAVRATAVSQLAEQPTSRVAQEMGLTDEQAAAMLARGKILMPAPAGSGKTRTVAAKIQHLVTEGGFRPSQVLATSFTRKSALELKERVEKLGVSGAHIGTTHSLAFKFLAAFAPKKVEAMKRGMKEMPSKLMDLAMAQVGLANTSNPTKVYAIKGYYKNPIGEWFNLGQKPLDQKGRAIGKKRLSNYIGKWKMGGWSPEEAWGFYQGLEREYPTAYFAAATYGAYEWLKNHNVEGPVLDFDDWLIELDTLLKTDAKARESIQKRYRAVIVDEAQDLNTRQHSIFDAIAGQAEVYAYVGDVRQAIYGFRGANPDAFSNKMSQGFTVSPLTVNFRSGKSIVDAADKLIALNENPLVTSCLANEERKGMGAISCRIPKTHEDAAVDVATEIAEMVASGSSTPDDFGVVIRNNAEADAYALMLMARGVPFRSKSNPFDKPIIKALLSWLRINSGGPASEVNEAVLVAHRTPGFYMDKQFQTLLQEACPRGMTYLDYLLNDHPVYRGSQEWRNRNVRQYAAALREVASSKGNTSEVLNRILNLQGAKESFQESLVRNINAEDIAEDLGREPTEEELAEAALVPVRPILKIANKFADPSKVMDMMDKLKRANTVFNKSGSGASREPAVLIDTVHQWKGLEAKNIYVSMADGVFPPSSELLDRDSTPDPIIQAQKIQDERRLAYVAITRGEDSVTILCPQEDYRGKDGGISQFVDEACIGIEGINEPSDEPDEESLDKQASQNFAEVVTEAVMGGSKGE